MTDSTIPLDAPEPPKPRTRTGSKPDALAVFNEALEHIAEQELALNKQIAALALRRSVVVELRDRILNKGDDE